MATGFSYSASRRDLQGQRIARLLPRVRDIRRLGAAAADLCFVAAGRLDAYFEEGLQAWDLAAGQLIASEAGATLSNFVGETITPSEVLVASPRIHGDLLKLLLPEGKESTRLSPPRPRHKARCSRGNKNPCC